MKHVQIAQYGERITGNFEGPKPGRADQGKVNGHHVEFETITRTVLHFRGQVYGNNMSGMYGINGKHAAWQAVRPAPIAVQPAPAASANSDSPAPAPQSADQLDALVSPIALYPDSLVAQVLAAATFPEEVTDAHEWLHQNSSLTGAALAQAVDQQSWDPSVKALTQFPPVLDNLAANLGWTSSLGQAFHFQEADVMAAVQTMRARAKAAGTLQSTSQITITQPTPSAIVIQPANPQIVYVPQYNPAIVYGAPLVVPLYQPPVAFATASVTFGAGISIGRILRRRRRGGWRC